MFSSSSSWNYFEKTNNPEADEQFERQHCVRENDDPQQYLPHKSPRQ